ncbi:cytochrome c oxidase assembly protein COX11, mitochondrial isoform X2 [Gossypium australe]|uniref:Cytochrome c oxidase assembly protein COX11, mitochondrial isoform X2 n=1 Tax=Gossypium australe TaxID=47621 RepID=A0A5B6UKL1_9ROSI|nr:cytochrome c oxidase assembly protein COX11, mitochondrial isoform X2 [Gossypium australe]KAA3458620.1 cytochrome c oxidase assembly protein COX11, mitochondrial isoform X2 [Gossypium australe]
MSWSRILSRISLLNHSKNLRILSHESRFLPDSLYSSYKFFKAFSRCGNNGLMLRCEFSTKPLTRSFDFHPYGSRCLVRLSSISSQRHYASHASHASTERKSKKTLLYLTVLVFAMVGSSYAAVPLYRRFCQATGYGGTVQRRESVEEKIAWHEKDRAVATREMEFNADVVDGMPWKFFPTQREVRVKPRESALAFYTNEN